jgi:hypothetical protein
MTKYYKNPERNKSVPFQPYTPQWQLRGITPVPAATGEAATQRGYTETERKSVPLAVRVLPKADSKIANKEQHPKNRNLPYAEAVEMSSQIVGRTVLPNVGNIIENAWSGMDEIIFDEDGETFVDPDRAMIDNNFDDETNYAHIPQAIKSPPETQVKDEEIVMVFDASQLNIDYDEYLLLVKGEVVSTGHLDQIQEEVQAFVFNEHPSSKENIAIDDLVVLKRVKVKVGVFLGE